jgi:hypothetical protein
MWGISENFEKLPKVNDHPLGENSPNLVTLTPADLYRDIEICKIYLAKSSLHSAAVCDILSCDYLRQFLDQGCQIFLGATYQNWKNVPK